MKVAIFANTDWYLFNFRKSLAIALRDEGYDVLLISPKGPFGKLLENDGFRWIVAPLYRRSLNPINEIYLIFWLKRLFQREKVDLVHSCTIKNTIYGSIAARLARVPARVNSISGIGYIFINTKLTTIILRQIVKFLFLMAFKGNGVRLILQNSDDVRIFLDSRMAEKKLLVLIKGSGVNCQYFYPCHTRTNGERRFRVLLAARILWDKGLAEYIEAAKELKMQHFEIDFLLAGKPDSGNPASVPENYINKWVNDGTIQWLGHVLDMPALFHTVDIVVLPSYREGLPKSLIEAAACGLPIITTNVPGCREVVTDGVDGLLIPVRDFRALADAIAKLYNNKELRQKLGTNARRKVLQQFDDRIVISKTLAVYRELLQ